MWANPEIRQKILNQKKKIENSKEYQELQRNITKENWNNPQTRKNRTKAIRKSLNKIKYKEKQSFNINFKIL